MCFAQILLLSILLLAPLFFHCQDGDGDDADNLSHESADNFFRDDDANDLSESCDDDIDDNAAATDVPVDSIARCSSHRCQEHGGGCTSCAAGRVAAKSFNQLIMNLIGLLINYNSLVNVIH